MLFGRINQLLCIRFAVSDRAEQTQANVLYNHNHSLHRSVYKMSDILVLFAAWFDVHLCPFKTSISLLSSKMTISLKILVNGIGII